MRSVSDQQCLLELGQISFELLSEVDQQVDSSGFVMGAVLHW